jgi:cation transport protein ChaC
VDEKEEILGSGLSLLGSVDAPRDPAALLAQVRTQWGGLRDLWLFGYASLIWRPDFEPAERREATVYGWHRALKMRSRVNRGTFDCPGLVFALVKGGSCRGVAYRIARERVEAELPRLWAREMPNAVYDAKWLPCRTPQGPIEALAFTLSRRSPNHVNAMSEAELIEVLRTACGRYGRTLDYLIETAESLKTCGIRDREIERLVALARAHELVRGQGLT